MDRNGNYITIGNDEYGLLRTVTDTLGRVINVNYDNENNPTSITQNWQSSNGQGAAAPHTYATFNYVTPPVIRISRAASAFTVRQNVLFKLLGSISYPDGSSTRFDYNAYGQVYKVSNIAADSSAHVLITRRPISNLPLPDKRLPALYRNQKLGRELQSERFGRGAGNGYQ
jgi:uncharacterized protein RhaS with RHS repeats